jgi:hypothetical protein
VGRINSREIRPALLGDFFIKDRAEAVLAKLPLIGLAKEQSQSLSAFTLRGQRRVSSGSDPAHT